MVAKRKRAEKEDADSYYAKRDSKSVELLVEDMAHYLPLFAFQCSSAVVLLIILLLIVMVPVI